MAVQLVLAVLLVVAAAAALLARRSPPSPDRAVAAARAHAARGAAAAPVAGLVAAVAVGTAGLGDGADLGVTALLVPVAYGAGALVALLVAELSWPRPESRLRAAELTHRGILDAAPGWLVRAGAGAVACAVVVLVGGTLLADASGRGFAAVVDGVGGRATPFPGATYAGPAAVGLAVVWVLALVGLRVVAERASVTLDDPRSELALRRASAHRVLRTAAGTTAVVAGGLLAVGGNAVRSVTATTGGDGTVATVAAVLGLLAVLGGALLVWLPAPGLPAPAAPTPTGIT
ncbi:MAG: hypothetical protein F2825_11530 [Actinobacteria bacterium]|uniref:Unannotated protein n=1 Tax=freshwater metagenome TaxID=449393 RepID=A0A6J7IW72_9ZZZZ|nr:hypothetical protein [Actinomycetota bacterium]